LKSALKLLEDALPALKTDVDAKLKAKKDAVDAVLLKDDSVASKINADDDADFAVLTALRAKN
jgi:Holliday junction resolvase RusA-like endonuclease